MKLMNSATDYVEEALEGVFLAHPEMVRRVGRRGARTPLTAAAPRPVIVTGGGFGHLPLFLGYVGPNFADAAVIGNVFTSPAAEDVVEVAQSVENGGGVMFLIGNYFGDRMNFAMAVDELATLGIDAEVVIISDDVASAPKDQSTKRRGVAGIIPILRIAAGLALSGISLTQLTSRVQRVARDVATMGFALSPNTLPGETTSAFSLPTGQIEIGIGIHGEAGIHRGPWLTAHEIAITCVSALVADLGIEAGDRVGVLINSLGATPPEELYIFNRSIRMCLANLGIAVVQTWVGEFATSLEMAGGSLTVIRWNTEAEKYLGEVQSGIFGTFR